MNMVIHLYKGQNSEIARQGLCSYRAATGLGRSIAVVSTNHMVKVVIADLTESGTQETVETIKKTGGDAAFVKVNGAEEDHAQKLVESAVEHFGALHGAANNAGLAGDEVSFIETSNELWEKPDPLI